MTRNKTLRIAGLAAVILLAPGGFVLGATLLARRYRARRDVPAEDGAEGQATNDRPCPPDGGSARLREGW